MDIILCFLKVLGFNFKKIIHLRVYIDAIKRWGLNCIFSKTLRAYLAIKPFENVEVMQQNGCGILSFTF